MRKRTHPPGGSPDAPSFEAADWLAVSTDGFASMNAGRDPAHLVKELVQNALDALGDSGGRIVLNCWQAVPGRCHAHVYRQHQRHV